MFFSDFPRSKFGFYSRGGIEYFFNSKLKGLFGIKSNIGYGKLQGFGNNLLKIGNHQGYDLNFRIIFFDAKIRLSYLLNFGLKITLSDRLTLNDVKVDVKGYPLDSDKDGILDYLDKCENTPLGVTVNKDIQIVGV